MKKIFNGSDIVFEAIATVSDIVSQQKNIKQLKQWNKRTLFVVNKKLHYYLDNASWITIQSQDIQEIRQFTTKQDDYNEIIRDKYVIQLKYSDSVFAKTIYCLFEQQNDSQGFYTVMKAFIHPDRMIQYFVNPGISIVSICLLYKAITEQNHGYWLIILQNQQQYQKLFRQSDIYGVTPLHIAAYFNMTIETGICIQSGCYLNSQMDYDKLTPLHLSIKNVNYSSQAGCFELLINNHAKDDIQDAQGNTVAQLVRQNMYGSKFHAILDNDSYINCHEINDIQ